MDRNYVSEFTLFMNHYLDQHPEVVKAQKLGWDFDWNPEFVDPVAQREAEEDRVPDDLYGFNWFAACSRPEPDKSH